MNPVAVLTLLPETLAVVRMPPTSPLPLDWACGEGLLAFVRTQEELSIVCSLPKGFRGFPKDASVEPGWRAFKVAGPLDFSQVGILASIAVPLAEAGVSIFAISTFDTDYILVKEKALVDALLALRQAGHDILG